MDNFSLEQVVIGLVIAVAILVWIIYKNKQHQHSECKNFADGVSQMTQKAKQLWNNVQSDIDVWENIEDSFCSLVDDNQANIVVIIRSKSYLLRPLDVSSVPDNLQKGQKARIIYGNILLGGSAKIVTPTNMYEVH